MPPDFNRVTLIGRLTRDIELRHTGNNQAVANLGLAIGRKYKTQSGEQREETTFVDCEAWGKQGEILSQYLKKGDPVFLEGRLKLDQWQDRDGNKQSKIRVVVENFQFLGGGGRGDDSGGGRSRNGGSYDRGSSGGGSRGGQRDEAIDIDADDIPF